MTTTKTRDRKPAAPAQRRAARGAREGVRRDPRRGLRRPRRGGREVHPRRHRVPPPARRPLPDRPDGVPLQARLGARDCRPIGGEDPREHGDRPQRHARPVGLDERSRHQLPDLGLGHRLARLGLAPLPQLRPPHLHEHPRQGQGPRLRDHADRPEPEVASGLPRAAVLQRPADAVLRVGGGGARPRLRRDQERREADAPGPRRAQEIGKKGAQPDRSRTTSSSRP